MNANATATFTIGSSHTENYAHVLAGSPNTFHPLTQFPPQITTIEGILSDRRRLVRPITIVIEYDDGEFVVSEPEFHMHASASTESEAIEAFRRILSGYLDVLTSRENKLGPQLRDQLNYLRSAPFL